MQVIFIFVRLCILLLPVKTGPKYLAFSKQITESLLKYENYN